VGIGRYAPLKERFERWRGRIRAIATCANVSVKIAGLGLPFAGFASTRNGVPVSSEQLAEEWRPFVEECISAFGASRCMFASNFPVDVVAASYPTLWNAFKRLAKGGSEDERNALFFETARRAYGLALLCR